ncbi:MAG: hypothetical protein JO303_17075 [Caulobacteraceae bacterium]|nr:hypothetical protein [Caulobacteraceae bacterium]
MKDRLFFSVMAAAAAACIALAVVWPQGFGARSPAPFGHALLQPPETPPSAKPKAPAFAPHALENAAALAAGLRTAH